MKGGRPGSLRDAVRVEGSALPSTKGRAVSDPDPGTDRPLAGGARLRHRQPPLGAEGPSSTSAADARAHRRPPAPRSTPRTPWCCPASARSVAAVEALAQNRSRRRSPSRRWASGRPFLGICVGMQLLLRRLRGGAGSRGARRAARPWCGCLPEGRQAPADAVERACERTVRPSGHCSRAWASRPWMYFVHSYAPEATPDVVATCDYGGPVTAARAGRQNGARPRSSTPRSRGPPAWRSSGGACPTSSGWPLPPASAERARDAALSRRSTCVVGAAYGSTRATTDARRSTATTRSRRLGRSRPTPARSGSTSSTSTPPAPASR